jgi:hemerythrin superfamily protein
MQGECAMVRRHDPPKLPTDGIALLQADHRQVEALFAKYTRAKMFQAKRKIAAQVCLALDVHAQLEETVFYPAFAQEADWEGKQLVAESFAAHQTVKDQMAALEACADEDTFDTQFRALIHTVQQHVQEEERELFPQAEEALEDHLEDLMDEMVDLQQHLTTATK